MLEFLQPLVSLFYRHFGTMDSPGNPAGSIHAKLAHLLTLDKLIQASDDLRAAADTQQSVTNDSGYAKVKEIVVPITGVIRTSFDMRRASEAGASCVVAVRSNYGTLRTGTPGEWVTYTEDMAVEKGDAVMLYATRGGSDYLYVRNFRIFYSSDDARTDSPIITKD